MKIMFPKFFRIACHKKAVAVQEYLNKMFFSSNETSVLQIPEEPDYFRNTWMPAFQAGTSVFMQIIWSWKLGYVE